MSWRKVAQQITETVSASKPQGPLLLQVCCFHNRGFRFFHALIDGVHPNLVINLGDISGIGGIVERAVVASTMNLEVPQVFLPGNHDSALTSHLMASRALVMGQYHRPVIFGKIRVWGYADPNHSPLGGPPYDNDLCRSASLTHLPPEEVNPYLIAVHNASMVKTIPENVSLVLCGHAHVPKVYKRGHATIVRCGTTGGGGLNFPGKQTALQAVVIELKVPEHTANHIWLVETDGKGVKVEEV